MTLPPAPQLKFSNGRGSWYSQYQGKHSWVDHGDRPNSNALGVPDDKQGIALYDRATLGKWFKVTAPNNVTLILQQTDIGPHPDTGRKIDIAAVAAERFGYSPSNFPTDEIFTWTPTEAPMSDTTQSDIANVLATMAQAMSALDKKVNDLAKAVAAPPSSMLSQLTANSPFLAILLGLAQAVLTNVDVMGVPGVGGTPTANITASSVLAMFLAGLVNWMKPKEPAK